MNPEGKDYDYISHTRCFLHTSNKKTEEFIDKQIFQNSYRDGINEIVNLKESNILAWLVYSGILYF